MARQIALLRGVNVGATRRVAMSDLRALLVSRGYGDVRTHLQSGNVVLDSDVAPEQLARAWHPGGIHRSRLAGLISQDPLGVTLTTRNRSTVERLLAMAGRSVLPIRRGGHEGRSRSTADPLSGR